MCVLAKRNKDSKLIWSRRPPAQPPPKPQPLTDTTSPIPTTDDTTPFLLTKDDTTADSIPPPEDKPDDRWAIGECISYDNVGPISPESPEGYKQFISFRDTKSKHIFNYPVKTCDEDTFLYYLARVLRFFTSRGFKPRILRSDYYTTFVPPKQTHSTKTINAGTRAPPPTNNGKTPSNGTYRPSWPTSPQQYTAKTSSAPTYGHLHSHIGQDSTTPYLTPSSRIPPHI